MAERKRKVCLYIGTLQRGGAERVLGNLAESLFEEGFAVTLVTSYCAPPEYLLPHALWNENTGLTPEGADDPDAGIRRVLSEPPEEMVSKGRLRNFLTRFSYLRAIWKKENPDVILAFIGKCNLMAILTSRGLGIPVAVSVRALPAEEYRGRAMHLMADLLFPLADAVILQAQGALSFFRENVRKKAVILPNPLNPAFLQVQGAEERQKEIVCVGRLDENKDQALLLSAFAQAREKCEAVRAWTVRIYGDGPDREKLEKEAKALGLGTSAVFAGNVPDVAERIRTASVFVLPSRTEGMPNSLLEAMSLGLACIASDCPVGVPAELIQDGENGLLFPVGDRDALSDAIIQFASDEALRERCGKEALFVRERFAPERVFAQWRSCLEKLMDQKQ